MRRIARNLVAALALGTALGVALSGCVVAGAERPPEETLVDGTDAADTAEMEDLVALEIEDLTIGVPVRSYVVGLASEIEPWATLVWAHGGSFVHGDLDWPEADWISRRLAEAGIHVYSVDYSLATERVKAPVPSDDVAGVLRHVLEAQGGPVAVGGASAGAHLATIAALQQAEARADAGANSRAPRSPDALILIYPTLHRVRLADAALAAAVEGLPEQRRFREDRIDEMYDFYLGAAALRDPASTLVAGEAPAERLALLPPTAILTADLDELRPSGERFAEQLRAAGVPVTLSTQPGTVHGYLNRPEESPAALADARASIDHMIAELRRMLGDPVA